MNLESRKAGQEAGVLDQAPGALPLGCDLDSLLTAGQMALWLQMSEDTVLRKARKGELPCIREGSDVRFHPRTYLVTRGAVLTRWAEAQRVWRKLVSGEICDTSVKRGLHRDFRHEFRFFEANDGRLPAGV